MRGEVEADREASKFAEFNSVGWATVSWWRVLAWRVVLWETRPRGGGNGRCHVFKLFFR